MIPMEPVNEKEILEKAEKLYALRPEAEKIADAVCEKGFDNILFTSAGGSLAALSPYCEILKHKTAIPTFTEIPAELITLGNPAVTDKTLAIMTSKSGDTMETLKAAEWLKEKGVTTVSFCGAENSPIAAASSYSLCYGEADPHDLVPMFLVGRIMKNKGFFDDYDVFADELKNLGNILVTTAKESEPVAKEYVSYFDPEDKEYQIWTGSGVTWGHTYSMAMCVLEECQWLRTKSVNSADFFHGTLEMVPASMRNSAGCCHLSCSGQCMREHTDISQTSASMTWTSAATTEDCSTDDLALPIYTNQIFLKFIKKRGKYNV